MITYALLDCTMVTRATVEEVNLLLTQLTDSPRILTANEIKAITWRSKMVVALDEHNAIKGMATLAVIHKLTGDTAVIEDVVVDASSSGRGIGTALVMKLIDLARACGIKKLELTSNPARAAANHLYQKLGFELRETNHYRMNL
jgi:ribosomal protein S18 acetylase RimI-like enzyme